MKRMRREIVKWGLIGLSLLAAAGCRFKGWESFQTATEPNPPTPIQAGDPYSYGSPAEASGGLRTSTSYNAGADDSKPQNIDPEYSRPALGSGQMPGESSISAAPGYGETNAPAFQPSASQANSTSNR